MVDVITPTVTYFGKGSVPAYLVTYVGFDGNGEYGVFDAWDHIVPFAPIGAILIVNRRLGTTNAIDVDLDVSMNNSQYAVTDINNITAKDTYGYMPLTDWGEPDNTPYQKWRYWKVTVVAVGANNTLDVYLWLM